jgi:L-iditol 2-dehydrogenase
MGAGQIILFDLVDEKLSLGKSLGFENCFNVHQVDPVHKVHELTGAEGAEVSVEAAGCPPTLLNALASAKREGRVVLLGNPSADVTLPAQLISQIMRREVQIVGTWNSDFSETGEQDDWREVLSAVAEKRIDLKPLITHRVGLSGSIQALEMMRGGQEFYSKVLIQPNIHSRD